MTKKIIFGIIITILCIACGKTLPYDDSDGKRLIVVNAIVTNTMCNVYITKSTRLSEIDSTFYVQGATVQISYANGQTKVLIPNDTIMGLYSFPVPNLQAGSTIHITVSHPQYNTVTSQIIVPSKVSCKIVDTVWAKFEESTFPSLRFVTVEIDDNPLEENYYILEMYSNTTYYESQFYYDSLGRHSRYSKVPYRRKSPFFVFPIDKSIEVVSDGYDMFTLTNTDYTYSDNMIQPFQILITDKNWNGTKHRETVEIQYPGFGGGTVYLVANVTAINKEFYEFAKSMAAYAYKQEFMGEPIQIATNITGGLGYFTAQLASFDSLHIATQDTSYQFTPW